MATEEKKMDETSTAENTVEVVKADVEVVDENKAKEVDSSIVVPQLSMAFQAHVAAAAVGVKYDEIINLPGLDFMAVTLKVSRFLSGAER